MKRLKILCFASMLIIFMVACFPMASKTIRALPVETKQQILAQYSTEQLKEGEQLFINNCGSCHKLKAAETQTPERWNKIVKRMIPKAKLNDQDGMLVRAYLIANAKDE